MNCLIIAAGEGSRLRQVSHSKPLTPVGGVPLIGHVVAAAGAAGATAFTVVTGYAAERVESYLATLPVPVRCVRAGDWRSSNGHSVLAGAVGLEGDYLLLMADHLFEPAIARRLISAGRGGAGVRLAVDRNIGNPLLDLDDATKVETSVSGAILRIGKSLDRYDAIDTGLFVAGPDLAVAIRADIEAGGAGSLSAGVQRLADQGQATVLDIGVGRWIDIDDPRSLALAEALFGPAAVRDNAA